MTTEAHDLTAADGTRVRLWERAPTDGADAAGDASEAVLFVHGATYPGRVVFDLDVGGTDHYSWLAAAASAGRAGFALDLRGYGDSERPSAMDAPADANPPPARAETVVADVRAALDAVGDRVDRVHLVGYSWGSVICGRLLAGGEGVDADVASLTQFAPVYRMDPGVVASFDPGDPAPAYRELTRAEVAERWDAQVPDDGDPTAWRGAGGVGRSAARDAGDGDPVLDAFWTALASSGQGEDGGAADATVRAPNGTLLDLRETADAAPYDPGRIDVPTLVVRGSEDPTATRRDAQALYDGLGGPREYAEVGGGTHFLPLEARREALYDLVSAFQDRASSAGGRE